MLPTTGQVLLIVLYSSVMIGALVGNVIVCWTVISSRRLHSFVNYFLVNLAVSDLMMAVLCIPFNFVANVLLRHWPFGPVLCPLVHYFQLVSVFLSAFTLLAISLDRYRAVRFPLRPRPSTRSAAGVIVAVWAAAAAASLPVVVVSRLSVDRTRSVRCNEAWPDDTHRYVYSVVVMVLQYFLPLSVMLFTYACIAVVIRTTKTPGEALTCRDQRLAASKRKMIRMLLVVVGIYAVCWFPLHVITIVGDVRPEVWRVRNIQSVWLVCHWLAMSSCAYNPIVYCWMNSRYRRGFAEFFRRCCCCCCGRRWRTMLCDWNDLPPAAAAAGSVHDLIPLRRAARRRRVPSVSRRKSIVFKDQDSDGEAAVGGGGHLRRPGPSVQQRRSYDDDGGGDKGGRRPLLKKRSGLLGASQKPSLSTQTSLVDSLAVNVCRPPHSAPPFVGRESGEKSQQEIQRQWPENE